MSAAQAPAKPPILIASSNPGKARELADLLATSGHSAATLADLPAPIPTFEENGRTYEENGLGKARHYARLSGMVAIADDSGLEVDALGGEPGVYSARYGGPGLDDAGRNGKLLEAMKNVPEGGRTARYVAVAVVARPDGEARSFRLGTQTLSVTSTSEGYILEVDGMRLFHPKSSFSAAS